MEQLTGFDASFLYIEGPTAPQHIVGVMLLAGSVTPDRLRDVIASRMHLMPAFARSLAAVPLHLDHPYWLNDQEVDLDRHLHAATLPAPGDLRALGRLVGQIASEVLPRDRPLWELWLIDGLASGQAALVAKMHHSTVYGAAGADMMASLLDLEPESQAIGAVPAAGVEQSPSNAAPMGKAMLNGARRPMTLARGVLGAGARVAALASLVSRSVRAGATPTLPFSAPRTFMNGQLTHEREAAFTRVAFADVKFIKETFGTKVNDVVLAAVTTSLRDYLLAREALPDKPLVAGVPVHVGAGAVAGTDKLSALMVPLPIQVEDAADRLAECANLATASKGFGDAMGMHSLSEIAELVPPQLMITGSKLYNSLGLARLHPPLQSLVVSNMPGPPVPLYLAGARVDAVYPLGALLPGIGLSITVLSNMGNLDVGLIACPDLVPDLWEIAEGFPAAVDELVARARAGS